MIDVIQDIINQIKTLGPEALTVGCVIGLGYVFKFTPFINNRYIPLLCILFGPLAYILIGDTTSVKFTVKNPEVVLGMFGLLYGVSGWILHYHVIWHVEQWVKKKTGRATKQTKEKSYDQNTDVGD